MKPLPRSSSSCNGPSLLIASLGTHAPFRPFSSFNGFHTNRSLPRRGDSLAALGTRQNSRAASSGEKLSPLPSRSADGAMGLRSSGNTSADKLFSGFSASGLEPLSVGGGQGR